MPRKKPFSVKQKKKQLQEKREKKRGENHGGIDIQNVGRSEVSSCDGEKRHGADAGSAEDIVSIPHRAQTLAAHQNLQTRGKERGYNPDRYRLCFSRDTDEEVKMRTLIAQREYLDFVPEDRLEIDIDDVYAPGSVLDMPERPIWKYTLSKDQLEAREETYFKRYIDNIFEKHSHDELSNLELNLETWRQLWRVIEKSDIVLLIVDIRHPVLNFSPTLCKYVNELNKRIILVLNKIDLVPTSLVVAWKNYFQDKFRDIDVVLFSSFARVARTSDQGNVVQVGRKRGLFTAIGPKKLLQACSEIVGDKVDLSSWAERIEPTADVDEHCGSHAMTATVQYPSTEHEQYNDGYLTIGCCGYPNVGKSSLINGLVGKKVVSTSRTPGHTKHFQTYFLTPTVRLCDSPGLVFPSLVAKSTQILAGIYPIAQVREPYTAVGYLAERVDVCKILKLTHPEGSDHKQWTAWDICEAWAEKRHFKTARAARNDVYRAANSILRMALEGRLCLCFRPPSFTTEKDTWEQHPEAKHLQDMLDAHCFSVAAVDPFEEEFSEDEIEYDPSSVQSNDIGAQAGMYYSNPFDVLGASD